MAKSEAANLSRSKPSRTATSRSQHQQRACAQPVAVHKLPRRVQPPTPPCKLIADPQPPAPPPPPPPILHRQSRSPFHSTFTTRSFRWTTWTRSTARATQSSSFMHPTGTNFQSFHPKKNSPGRMEARSHTRARACIFKLREGE